MILPRASKWHTIPPCVSSPLSCCGGTGGGTDGGTGGGTGGGIGGCTSTGSAALPRAILAAATGLHALKNGSALMQLLQRRVFIPAPAFFHCLFEKCEWTMLFLQAVHVFVSARAGAAAKAEQLLQRRVLISRCLWLLPLH
jgi:hypothetical protein